MEKQSGLLLPAEFIESPNQDDRPDTSDIDLIVIHSISLPPQQFHGEAVKAFFQNQLDPDAHPYFTEIAHLKVSAHLFIRREGQIIQFVSFHKRAWHAGKSEFAGRSGCNDFSIGIELEGADDIPYTLIQYTTLKDICILLRQSYARITNDRIVGHSDIASGRKTDPGSAFEWEFFRGLFI
ncbi:MAG: 1,6-anhydro-N-acetylmuramyl-L-alanine amidase AmpD [Legionellales bacterium]|nr:1,6-anhydro-N-acetylmuramyl-L-alanine amidase AmpD [Legionellales bacterium]